MIEGDGEVAWPLGVHRWGIAMTQSNERCSDQSERAVLVGERS